MSNRQKEIDALQAQIEKLKELQTKEEQEIKALEETNQKIFSLLDEAGLSLEAFIRYNLKATKRVMAKVEKEEAKSVPAPKKAPAKKRGAKKAARRGAKRQAKTTVKIPAGKYSNIPAAPDQVFEVKDKGPRPKALKAYAEEIGLESFMEQCLIG